MAAFHKTTLFNGWQSQNIPLIEWLRLEDAGHRHGAGPAPRQGVVYQSLRQ